MGSKELTLLARPQKCDQAPFEVFRAMAGDRAGAQAHVRSALHHPPAQRRVASDFQNDFGRDRPVPCPRGGRIEPYVRKHSPESMPSGVPVRALLGDDIRSEGRTTPTVLVDDSRTHPARADRCEVVAQDQGHGDDRHGAPSESPAFPVHGSPSRPRILRHDEHVDLGFDRPAEGILEGHDTVGSARERTTDPSYQNGPADAVRLDVTRLRLRGSCHELIRGDSDGHFPPDSECGGQEGMMPHVEVVERASEHGEMEAAHGPRSPSGPRSRETPRRGSRWRHREGTNTCAERPVGPPASRDKLGYKYPRRRHTLCRRPCSDGGLLPRAPSRAQPPGGLSVDRPPWPMRLGGWLGCQGAVRSRLRWGSRARGILAPADARR